MKSGKCFAATAIVLFLLSFTTTSCKLFKPPRCRVPGCKVRMIHAHDGKDYRGSPWWRTNKNPRVGQRFNDKTKVAN